MPLRSAESSGIDKANCVRVKRIISAEYSGLFGPLIELGGRKDLLACSCRRALWEWTRHPSLREMDQDTETQREAFPYPPYRPLPSFSSFSQNFSSAHCQAFPSAHTTIYSLFPFTREERLFVGYFVLRWKEKDTQVSLLL